MFNQLAYINNDYIELEESYISYIEEEIDSYFESCMNAANSFALMVAKDLQSYSKEAFETMVLAPKHVNALIHKINNRIYREMDMDVKTFEKINTYSLDFGQYDRILARRIRDYKGTQQITKWSEDIITNSFSYTMGDACSSNIVDYAVSKMKLGEKILGQNSNKGQIEKRHQQLYNHIEGMLINMKTKLKNDVIGNWLQLIHGEKEKLVLIS